MGEHILAPARLAGWLIDGCVALGLGILGPGAWLLSVAYWLARDGFFEGQSLGKRIMGLQVLRRIDGAPCRLQDSALRNLLWVIPVAQVVMGVTGLYYLLHDPEGQHWGDRLADTIVRRQA